MPEWRFTVLSLFSGGMGLDIGLDQTGRFKHLACVEKIPAFCDTIQRNRDADRLGNRDLKVYQHDIAELQTEQVMRDLPIAPGELDLLIGGPPCQTFSTTGPRKKRYLSMVPEGSNWRSLATSGGKESMGKAYFAKGGSLRLVAAADLRPPVPNRRNHPEPRRDRALPPRPRRAP